MNEGTFVKVLDRVKDKLKGWKAKHLSLAGRQVLAQSVLSTIPFYVMQSAMLPLGVCNKIDKMIRQFIWGGSNTSRACSLVKWDRVIQPKSKGGLGIRSAKDMNIAFMTKLGWRMMKEDNSLWANVLVNKYMGGTRDLMNIRTKKREFKCMEGNRSWCGYSKKRLENPSEKWKKYVFLVRLLVNG